MGEYNWSDENTYLSPSIPILKPVSLKISTPKDTMNIETHISNNAKILSSKIKSHIDGQMKNKIFDVTENLTSSEEHKEDLKVDVGNLQKQIANIEESLQHLTNEEIDGQLAVIKYTLKTLEDLESGAISIEARLQKLPSSNEVDILSLAALLTGSRTKLVTLHTQAESNKARIERYILERRKRITEIKRYQAILIDLEQWLGEAQATISSEIKLTSAKIVRDQIRTSESLELDLRARLVQLEHLLKDFQQLDGYVDVKPLIQDMTLNLGSLHGVMEDAQQCLEHRLKNLQEALREMVIGYPEGTDIEKELAASTESHLIKDDIASEWEVIDDSLMNVQFKPSDAIEFAIDKPSHDESVEIVQKIVHVSETDKSQTRNNDKGYDLCYNGKLKIIIRQAKDLEKKDVIQKADPYVMLEYGSVSSKTKKVKNTLAPVRNHEVMLDIDAKSPKSIELRLFDWERFGKDEAMGKISLSLDQAINISKTHSSWLNLEDCKCGQLLISTEFSGETVRLSRVEKGAKDLRRLLKEEKGLDFVSNETAEGNESKNKVVTNVIRKVTTTRKILRKVIIDGDGNEHVIEEIIDDPQVSISELEQPSIDIEEVQDKNDKLTSNSGLSKETLTNTSSKSEWTNIPIVRLDKMP